MNRLENKGVTEIKKLCGRHGISTSELIMGLNVVPVRIYEILSGKRSITPDTDLRLCRFFGLGEGYFCKLQLEHDLEMAKVKLGDALVSITPADKGIKAKR